MIFTFFTPESQDITIAYYREVDTNNSQAYIKVAKSTMIAGVSCIKGKCKIMQLLRIQEQNLC